MCLSLDTLPRRLEEDLSLLVSIYNCLWQPFRGANEMKNKGEVISVRVGSRVDCGITILAPPPFPHSRSRLSDNRGHFCRFYQPVKCQAVSGYKYPSFFLSSFILWCHYAFFNSPSLFCLAMSLRAAFSSLKPVSSSRQRFVQVSRRFSSTIPARQELQDAYIISASRTPTAKVCVMFIWKLFRLSV